MALTDAVQRYEDAQEELNAARLDLYEAICDEARAGKRQRELVEETKLTREHIRRICRAGGIGPD